ncbi:hypothetical protein, partial [Oceaniferula marina]|uniref:hypothetical protein n=1 Tax=Oceaniferula marina TaxID=2748318 RepID=UPI001D057C45
FTFGNNKKSLGSDMRYILRLAVVGLCCLVASQCRTSTKTSETADGFAQAHEFRIRAAEYHNKNGDFPERIDELIYPGDRVIKRDDWVILSPSEDYLVESRKTFTETDVPFKLAISKDYEVIVLKQ